MVVVVGCGGSDTTSRLEIKDKDEGTLFESHWSYRSFAVDVDLTLATDEQPASCSTTATLVVDDAVSSRERYVLEPTDCEVLRLTGSGDIVLFEHETGHDWSTAPLMVDTGEEIISLGPVSVSGAGGERDSVYQFSLSAPPCEDGADCDCGVLERLEREEEPVSLDLGRRCD